MSDIDPREGNAKPVIWSTSESKKSKKSIKLISGPRRIQLSIFLIFLTALICCHFVRNVLSISPPITTMVDRTTILSGNGFNGTSIDFDSKSNAFKMATSNQIVSSTSISNKTTNPPTSHHIVESEDAEIDETNDDITTPSDSSSPNGELTRVLNEALEEGADKLASKLKLTSSSSDENDDKSELSSISDVNDEEPQETTPQSSNINVTTSSSVNSIQPNSKSILISKRQQELNKAFEVYGKWRNSADDIIELISRKLLPLVMEFGYDIDPTTLSGLIQVFNGIRGLKGWALKLLDASTKLGPGILVGTQSDFGDFDECLKIRVDDPSGLSSPGQAIEIDSETGLPVGAIVGRYCLADVEFTKPPRDLLDSNIDKQSNKTLEDIFAPIQLLKPLYDFSESHQYRDTIFVETGNFFHMLYVDPIRVAMCLTNKIEPDSFAQVFNKLFADFNVSINFRDRCTTAYEKREWTSYQVVSFYIILVAMFLVALNTLIELLNRKLPSILKHNSQDDQMKKIFQPISNFMIRQEEVLTAFSLLRNTRRLFKLTPKNQNQIVKHYKANLGQVMVVVSENSPKLNPDNNSDGSVKKNMNGHNVSTSSEFSSPSASSSLESSPNIERRRSSLATTTGSDCQLITNDLSVSCKTSLDRVTNNNHGQEIINLNSLHGIRVITMIWMVINHTYMFGGFFVLWAHRRLIDIAEWPKSLSFQLVLNGWLTVETYFFLSAMIIVLNIMPLMKSGKFAFSSFVLHRLIRILPAYIGLVCLNFLWPLISNGPVWMVKGQSFIKSPCENYLWTNFLFINNWFWPEKQCMVHTWFLSADFQLYLFAPIVVWILVRRPLLGHTLNCLIAIVGSILSGLVIYIKDLQPTTLINKLEFDSIKQQLSYSYFATYQHLGPYCLGLFVGYILHQRPRIRLSTKSTWTIWILLPPLSLTTLLLTYLWNGAYSDESMINPAPIVSAFYVAIHRTIWSSLVAWIVFSCATGQANLLSSFLSHYLFVPLSRLSFSIYLVHMPIIMYKALNLKHTKEWTDENILWEACGNFISSCILGYFINIAFESPMINLERAFLYKGAKLVKNLDANSQEKLEQSCSKSNSYDGDHVDKMKDDQVVAASPIIPKHSPPDVKSMSITQPMNSDFKTQFKSLDIDNDFQKYNNSNQSQNPNINHLKRSKSNAGNMRKLATNNQGNNRLEISHMSTISRSNNDQDYRHNRFDRQAQYATLARTTRISRRDYDTHYQENKIRNNIQKITNKGPSGLVRSNHNQPNFDYNTSNHQMNKYDIDNNVKYNRSNDSWNYASSSDIGIGAWPKRKIFIEKPIRNDWYQRQTNGITALRYEDSHVLAEGPIRMLDDGEYGVPSPYMIPRIDSSTLRRNTFLNRDQVVNNVNMINNYNDINNDDNVIAEEEDETVQNSR